MSGDGIDRFAVALERLAVGGASDRVERVFRAPETPLAVARLIEQILDCPYALRRDKPNSNAPFVIGVHTMFGFDWYIVCRVCGWCSLPMYAKPAPVCEACADLADGHAHLRTLARVVDSAATVGDVVIDG